MPTSACIILDSVSELGDRLTTFEITLHRFVLAELNTHRVLSRNSASSRAIPSLKQIQRVLDSPAVPVVFPAEQPGMQGGEHMTGRDLDDARETWLEISAESAAYADIFREQGVHKSVGNRILEPFMWHTVILTGTSWGNFFGQRCSPLAQPEIRVAAELMKEAYDASIPTGLKSNEWHLPYIRPEDIEKLSMSNRIKISTARCARVSYLTHDGQMDYSKDLELYDRLVTAEPAHISPTEHVASPCADNRHEVLVRRATKPLKLTLPKYGNFIGWHQHRFDVESEKGYQSFS